MNKIIKKILVGDTLMPEIDFRQPGFIYSTCGPLTENIKIINHKNSKYDEYQRIFASMVYKLFDKKTTGGAVKNESIQNK